MVVVVVVVAIMVVVVVVVLVAARDGTRGASERVCWYGRNKPRYLLNTKVIIKKEGEDIYIYKSLYLRSYIHTYSTRIPYTYPNFVTYMYGEINHDDSSLVDETRYEGKVPWYLRTFEGNNKILQMSNQSSV